MKQCCKFQDGPDITEVVEGLGIDVNNAINTGIIEDKSASVFHNELQEFGQIGIVARDTFDIIDYSLNEARQNRKNSIVFASTDILEKRRREIEIIQAISKAIEQSYFQVYFQNQ
mgnify:CR=1 FL=1